MELAGTLLPLLAIALIFWLLLIRPQQRRQRQVAEMQAALNVGDDVMMTAGIYGTIRALDDDTVTLEVAEGVRLKAARAAIGSIVESEKSSDREEWSDPEQDEGS